MAGLGLYGYQTEVVERAVKGENIIIWLPTGGGKTRAATYVAKRHLETTPCAKVVVLVNKVHLVDQHYSKEFRPFLGSDYTVAPVSGVSDEKDFFGRLVQDSDVIICTAQILENALINTEEGRHVELSVKHVLDPNAKALDTFHCLHAADITLLIIDECHHTNKDSVYNKIMGRYVQKKLKGETPLPQVLGLTASPGTGGKKVLEKAVEHVLQICANLDSAIVSSKTYAAELVQQVPRPRKKFDIVERRPEDPFGDHLKWMMEQIHEFIKSTTPDLHLREIGTQEYEADVVILEQRGVRLSNRILAQCALHLREYNDALLINDTIRMIDAYCSLEDFYTTKFGSKVDGTDYFLTGLFKEHQLKLKALALDARYENPKLARLQETLLTQFRQGSDARGILFSKTRKSTHCLHDWVRKNPALQKVGIKSSILTGAGNGITYMTQSEQKDTIREFRNGTLNLLISTSVAEEGLDIPECNLVVRYGLLTNEIAQQQASGRARAPNSVYSVVALTQSREVRRERINEYLEELTAKAIDKVQAMDRHEFRAKISKLQNEALRCRLLEEQMILQRRSKYRAANIKLLCRNCFKPVALGSDVRLLEGHYVNINPEFEEHYTAGGKVFLERGFEDWEPGRRISCNGCNKEWGFEMKYKQVALLPNLCIKSFALDTPKGRITVKKWKDVEFTVDEFNFKAYCDEKFPDLFNED